MSTHTHNRRFAERQYGCALRGIRCTVLAGVVFGLSAAPADAGRAYGAFVPFTDLLTFELTDSSRQIRTAALRTELDCGNDRAIWYVQRLTVTRRQPARSIRNRGFLIAQRAPTGKLRYAFGPDLEARGAIRSSPDP